MTDEFTQKADQIWAAIQVSQNVLLHLHPSPDPDSVGSALAMAMMIRSLGKNATVIEGDTSLLSGLDVFPGSDTILKKNYFELDLKQYDLFIIQDSAGLEMISTKGEIVFPQTLTTIIIDHHSSNRNFASINLVEPDCPANCELLYKLFIYWKVEISQDTATCLLLGIYGDTGFKYAGTGSETYLTIAELSKLSPNFHDYIFKMENAMHSKQIDLLGLGFSNVHTYSNNRIAISEVTKVLLDSKNITASDVNSIRRVISSQLIAVTNWEIGIAFIEIEPNINTLSFRSRDPKKYNVNTIAVALGGGGHPVASGVTLKMPFDQARQLLLDTIYSVYPDLKSNV